MCTENSGLRPFVGAARNQQFKSVYDNRTAGTARVPFIANRSHLLGRFDILAHSPARDKQYFTAAINYMLQVAAYKSHN